MNLPTKEKFWHDVLIQNFIVNKPGEKKLNILDATCGNGYDTYFLAENFKDSNIMVIDINKEAIKNTKKKCEEFDNIKYYNMNYKDIDNLFQSQINNLSHLDIIVYNTGYFPGKGRSITQTSVEDLVDSIQKGMRFLSKNGIIVLMIYQGHDNGTTLNEVLKVVESLNKYEYISFIYKTLNTNKAPNLILIERKK